MNLYPIVDISLAAPGTTNDLGYEVVPYGSIPPRKTPKYLTLVIEEKEGIYLLQKCRIEGEQGKKTIFVSMTNLKTLLLLSEVHLTLSLTSLNCRLLIFYCCRIVACWISTVVELSLVDILLLSNCRLLSYKCCWIVVCWILLCWIVVFVNLSFLLNCRLLNTALLNCRFC